MNYYCNDTLTYSWGAVPVSCNRTLMGLQLHGTLVHPGVTKTVSYLILMALCPLQSLLFVGVRAGSTSCLDRSIPEMSYSAGWCKWKWIIPAHLEECGDGEQLSHLLAASSPRQSSLFQLSASTVCHFQIIERCFLSGNTSVYHFSAGKHAFIL